MNVAELAPAGTVTEGAGTGSSGLSLDSNTSVPPIGAPLLSVSVHVVACPVFKVLGLHVTEETEWTCPKAAPLDKQKEIAATATPLYFEKPHPQPRKRPIPHHGASSSTVYTGQTG
jgi:hypothetical protein